MRSLVLYYKFLPPPNTHFFQSFLPVRTSNHQYTWGTPAG
ncbi:hypothetical protein M23134_01684 [Microscilla marina ATCC 23134]|uniref:Uncharacterized protein n=1 Tax=Microscilla marina ATCC 23134 TaxID=313606 RepID=A1ZSV0_MICM2|nr:hypothetical protein M23134_01684 [Microscilla marina ATCC 23134]